MGAAASTLQPLPFDPHTFPQHGVQLSFLDQFLQECGGRAALEGLTTTEVCDQFIKPMTKSSQSSYCDFLREIGHEAVGEATVFISHAWKYNFLDVVDSLTHHFGQTLEAGVVVWFDLFSNNQHKAVELDFSYWATTFQSAIESFGRTVMVLAPWDHPIPLTRAWCLWELYCTAHTQSKFEVAMTGSARMRFIDDVLEDSEGSINRMLSQIDVKNSECFKPEDREQIFKAIKSSVGFSELNRMVFEKLQDWVIVAMREETAKGKNSTDARYLTALAGLYKGQGKYVEAESLYMECLDVMRAALGEDHPHTLSSMNNLAMIYKSQGKYVEAESLYVKCLDVMRSALGENHPDTLTSMNNLAMLYYSQGKYVEAESLCVECLEMSRSSLGENHPDILTSMNNLAMIYRSQGKYVEAESLCVKCLDVMRSILGENHPITLTSMSNLAMIYRSQGKYVEAESLYVKCLDVMRAALGEDHPDTLSSMSNLAMLYDSQGKYVEAESLCVECLEMRTAALGENHPDILISMNNLATIYRSQGKYVEAESLCVECLDVMRSILGENHPITLTSMSNLAMLYYSQGKYDDAESLLAKCLKMRTSALGENHPDTLESMNGLARLRKLLGK
jgi:tetratricopeptide (TPR) repeat protein